MASNLKEYFPLIHTRTELLAEIHSQEKLDLLFHSWSDKQQEEFLDFCTGVRGVKLLYDSFFKEIMSPEATPERLEELLSILLGSQVKILDVLPNDSTRLADEQTLLITDIVVELADGRVVNVEVQKIGYHFPGQRSACYSSDLLLRQYKRVRGRKGSAFTYRDICAVYTIVLFEKSPAEFFSFPDTHIHFFSQKSNTGLELKLLQNYCFIPLDIFRKNMHNKGISNKLDAWLAFLCMDDPEVIVRLISLYPEFKAMYEQIYSMCRNVEGVMNMFSEELRMLDRNTVRLMIDEQQEAIEAQRVQIEKQRIEIEQQRCQYEEERHQYEEECRRHEEERRRHEEECRRHEEECRQHEEERRRLLERIAQLEGEKTK